MQKTSKADIRKFGIALTVFLAIIGLIYFFKHNPIYLYFWIIGGTILIISIFIPILLKPIYRAALFIAHILGWINTRFFLVIIYYFILTPISLVFKLIGKDPLNRKFDRQGNTYWDFKTGQKPDKDQYLKQF